MPYECYLVEFTDSVVNFASKEKIHQSISKENDWRVMEYLVKGWMILFPRTAEDFITHMKEYRSQQIVNHAAKEEKGGAWVQHQLEVPKPLYQMIMALWPKQVWDHKFTTKFAKRFPVFAGGDKL